MLYFLIYSSLDTLQLFSSIFSFFFFRINISKYLTIGFINLFLNDASILKDCPYLVTKKINSFSFLADLFQFLKFIDIASYIYIVHILN